ncbi:Hypothetical predicted protein [Lecanosticta acicola]|uniref:Uncharacterized protein n=1 Tax=Lecanosticta acicola TaxID=111012 RepID=A0AAI8Z3P1_9PEZI|nr:Hypothetical predicted protein [Lecanosticta acicola]
MRTPSLAIIVSLASTILAAPASSGTANIQVSLDTRQSVVNVEATIVSLINDFVQGRSGAPEYAAVKSQLTAIGKVLGVTCAPTHTDGAKTPPEAIVALGTTQNSLNQLNLDITIAGADLSGDYCAAWSSFRSVGDLANGKGNS